MSIDWRLRAEAAEREVERLSVELDDCRGDYLAAIDGQHEDLAEEVRVREGLEREVVSLSKTLGAVRCALGDSVARARGDARLVMLSADEYRDILGKVCHPLESDLRG